MKTLILLLLIYANCLAQQDSIQSTYEDDAIKEFLSDPPPQLIGGIDSLLSRLQYPNDALEHGIEGTVYIDVTIDTSGIPSNPKILNHLGFGCDEEALRLVLTSKYTPGFILGKKTKLGIAIPIKFRLPKGTN